MSDLDDLGDIADQCHFGGGQLVGRQVALRPRPPMCNSPDHMAPGNVRLYRKGRNGKFRTVCKLCDAVRKPRPRYSADGYPL